jgi:hypothetical protein
LIIPQLEIGPPDSKRPHSRAGSPPPVVSVSLSVPVASVAVDDSPLSLSPVVAPPVDVDVPVAALVPASLVEPAPVLASLALVVALVASLDPASPSSP